LCSLCPTHFLRPSGAYDVLQQISSWMFANILTLNSCKTEFLSIALRKQLYKIDNSALTSTLHATLVLFLMSILHIKTKLSVEPDSACIRNCGSCALHVSRWISPASQSRQQSRSWL